MTGRKAPSTTTPGGTWMFTPPLTPSTPAHSSPLRISTLPPISSVDLDTFSLPPPMAQSDFGLTPIATAHPDGLTDEQRAELEEEARLHAWKSHMTPQEKGQRVEWLSKGRGRRGLRIVIVTENFLPKVDGVTRTLARLLEHLKNEGHQCMLLGPGSAGMETYAGHPLVGTLGVPLVVYPGLKLNFLRPRFLRTIKEFQPDVVHFVDPIWLGAQTLIAMELGWAGEQWVTEDGPALGSGINGPIVASYHTNLATYATLFGMPWLEPILWRFQCWLYSKTLITLCPSPSTRQMLHSNNFLKVNLWPRGVDLSQFSPTKRSPTLRAEWGVGPAPSSSPASITEPLRVKGVKRLPTIHEDMGIHFQGRKASLPLTPPESPAVGPGEGAESVEEVISLSPLVNALESISEQEPVVDPSLPRRVVLLFVGRISWEKNIHLLLKAYSHLPAILPPGSLPKLVFVGDGPARAELSGICQTKGYDAVFMGQRVGEDLARCFASADVFAFPSFTETFGQVVLEALASGLPVVGLDAEGTRDLVQDTQTGLLLPLPSTSVTWPTTLKNPSTAIFDTCAVEYAKLLARAVTDHNLRTSMGQRAATEGIKGFTWWDAMESCVDGYRESIWIHRQSNLSEKAAVAGAEDEGEGKTSRVNRMNRVVSRSLAHRDAKRPDTRETIWHLKTLFKFLFMLGLVWVAYRRHLAGSATTLPISA